MQNCVDAITALRNIDENYKGRIDVFLNAVSYTHLWALRQFFEEARKQPWFDNTIFVLEGDHGKLVGDAECELPERCV